MDVDPDAIDADLNPEIDTDPAMRVLPAVERVSIDVCATIHKSTNARFISSERLSGPSVQVLNVANPGHVRFSLCTLKEAIQARFPVIARRRVC